ncbi:MAG: 23S rRNA (uracil(1939)-C(5))-methyltransferase RlmD [Flavobacteriaceae bacterium]|tara:strand:- start:5661 stop:7073 length:1413 start_codon:yes stop_codon:yes gene_type:complete
MSRKRKKNIILQKLKLSGVGSLGKGFAKTIDKKIIFTKYGVPGDIVDVNIRKKRSSYLEGDIIKIHKQSKLRVKPKCSHFKLCGGCNWQNMEYDYQLKYKNDQVLQNLMRIGKIQVDKILPIIKSDKQYYYRNKMEYSFSNSRWITKKEINSQKEIKNKNALGFHKSGMWSKIIDINKCYLQENISNKIRNYTKDLSLKLEISFFDLKKQSGDLRNLMIRTSKNKEIMVFFQIFKISDKIKQLFDKIIIQFPEITCLQYVINKKKNDTIYDLRPVCYHGKKYITETIGKYHFRISAKSFFQTNSYQIEKLYNIVKRFANLSGSEIVYDLYCGTGSISIYLSSYAKKIIGIEVIVDAVVAAKENAKANNINNTTFLQGDVKEILKKRRLLSQKPDVIIVDPPRNGLDKLVVESIIKSNVTKIIYVSCNSATQARDLNILSEYYNLTKSQAIDMFPQTYHVENVVLLEKIYQ